MRRSQAAILSVFAVAVLSACNSAGDVLQPSAVTPQSTQSVPLAQSAAAIAAESPATQASSGAPGLDSAQTAAILRKTRLQIAPIVGATVEAATPLSEHLATRARDKGITLAGSTDTSATLVMKGYFSVLTEGKDTSVIYVWDVYDPSGNRLHRINGQQKAPSVGGTEGWPAVAPATMQVIADQTIDQLTAWLANRTG